MAGDEGADLHNPNPLTCVPDGTDPDVERLSQNLDEGEGNPASSQNPARISASDLLGR
jgi:hypothetical protein